MSLSIFFKLSTGNDTKKEMGYKFLEEGVKHHGSISLMGAHRYNIEWNVIKDEERYKSIYGDNYLTFSREAARSKG